MGSRYEFMPNEHRDGWTEARVNDFIYKALLGLISVVTAITLPIAGWACHVIIEVQTEVAVLQKGHSDLEDRTGKLETRVDGLATSLQNHHAQHGSSQMMDENIVTPPQ
jgi:hypothetical protein